MAHKFGSPIDLQQLEILRARLQQSAGDPAAPVEGQIWYDSVAKKFKFRDNDSSVDPTARAEHTGTQLAATISDFNTAVRTNRLDQMAAPTADVSANGQKITNLAAPAAGTDGANKAYVDATSAGRDWKDSVRVATTAAVALATAFENGDTLDGVVLATGDRVLIKDQAAGAENGIYTVNASGAPTRATDADTSAEMTPGVTVTVEEGTANADSRWVLTTNGPIVLGTTALTFTRDAGESVTAGTGLTKTGTTVNVGAGAGILANADDLAIDPAVVVRKFTALIGDGAATSIVVTHNLNNQWAIGIAIEVATLEDITVDIDHTSANTMTFIFAVAPATNSIRVSIMG